jgi:hypothetical protein
LRTVPVSRSRGSSPRAPDHALVTPDLMFTNGPTACAATLRRTPAFSTRLVEARGPRGQQESSATALAEYARTCRITYERYHLLKEAAAAVGAKRPTTVVEWEQRDDASPPYRFISASTLRHRKLVRTEVEPAGLQCFAANEALRKGGLNAVQTRPAICFSG